ASTVIGDIYQNAGTSSGGIELTGPSAISGDGSSGLTVGQVAQANKNQKAAKETVDVAKAQAELRKARTNRAWAIFALAVAGGLALSAVLAYAGGMAHTPFTKAAVVAAAIIGAAAIGFAMYQVLKNYGDGVNISGGLKAFMGVTMGLTAGLVLMSALVPSVAKFINTKITVHVLKFLHTTLGGLIGTTAATSVAQTSYSQIKQGDAAKGTYDATVNASNQKVK
ncbi:MAG: hypothetical protein LBI01_00580, partial [Elusimicrobium sp.]|nr:hypothetical protein [Elusimicrobium sp.]